MRVVTELKGVHRVRKTLASGKVVYYHYAWRGGPRIMADPKKDKDAFIAEFRYLTMTAKTEGVLTLEGLIEVFTGTNDKPNPDFLALSESTQRDHLYAFRLIREKWPRLPARLTQQRGMKRDIIAWHRSFAEHPRKADKLLFSLSKVFSYAIKNEYVEKNPCTGIDRLYRGSRREFVWTDDFIARVRSRGKPHIVAALEVAVYTGQRQGDILALTWPQYDGQHLLIRQGKTGKRVKIRVHKELKKLIDRLKSEAENRKIRSAYILTNSRGRPWTKDGFKTSWGKQMRDLGIEGVTFHDLRGTFITDRRREGSTVEQIASISGHSISEVSSVLEKHYLADDQQASDAVITRMERTQRKRKP
ncbi:integrase [Martelella alba]|uniref:Integrase n=1 Tax=Martelella alba TaxID=2590451 RepID=A0A506U889_9HYPH|nr:tyrosine-type recombinase/integrase [Martelella alba]TPW29698.1 integrase [Martelella alba]